VINLLKEYDMTNKNVCKSPCANTCPCGWFNKRVFGVTVGVWLIVFAILPFSASGVAWTAKNIAGLWDSGAKAVGVERPQRRNRGQVRDLGNPDWIDRGDGSINF
tara:strand:+ start:1182 stop:1496 length:315 start_codon:yes stop_codon:yes gene_type:complete